MLNIARMCGYMQSDTTEAPVKDYTEFLSTKRASVTYSGFEVEPESINPMAFLFQRDIVRWAVKLGKAAVFAECGLGKTIIQLDWARLVNQHTGRPVIILAPLAVTAQTVREGEKFNVKVVYCEDQSQVGDNPIVITNYERLHLFDASHFGAVVAEESSILKNYTGKTKQAIIEALKDTPYKLACTATPAPNDHMELGNHADFLNVMASNEMLSRWFINDTMHAGGYRLKGHAEDDFWRWLTSWAVCISKPADMGAQYDMPGFDLPKLHIKEYRLAAAQESIDRAWAEGRLMPDTAPSATNLHKVKRESLSDRVKQAVEIYEAIDDADPILIWCDTNYEADELRKVFPDAVEVRGADSNKAKEDKLLAFGSGEARVMITKADIAGFGLNYQHCNQHIYIGLSYSFEKFYQALRRSYRFGQQREMNAHIIYAETEGNIIATIASKQEEFKTMQQSMNKAMLEHGLFREDDRRNLTKPESDTAKGTRWEMHLGDCIPFTASLPDNHIDLSVYSPPFGNLYIYSDSEADMGNASDDDEFFGHYEYLVKELYRTTKPGRLSVVHCKDLPAYQNRDGAMGLIDFPGKIIRLHEAHGWQYHSRVTIWKDPVIEMQRTKNHGLLHKNFTQRAEGCRQGMADYLIVFRKWPIDGGEHVTQKREPGDYIGTKPPIEGHYEANRHSRDTNYSIQVWQRYASPVWFDIDQTNVLNYTVARDNQDEKHICPLQLDVIARSVDLWSNKDDLVYSPFAGIGSEGVESVKLGRRFLGAELKRSYFNYATKYLTEAERQFNQVDLFEYAGLEVEGK